MSRCELSFGTWNLNWFTRSRSTNEAKIAYLAGKEWQVVALQEATPAFLEEVEASGIAETIVAPKWFTSKFTSALLARGGVRLYQPSMIAEQPYPERALWACAERDGHRWDVLSWHAPNAARQDARPHKRAAYIALDRWSRDRRRPTIVGADANHGALYTRESDFPDSPFLPFPEDDWSEESRFWTAEHPVLRDAWLDWLAREQVLLDRLRSTWTGGPSAVSYVRGSRARPVPDRFDYVLVSDEFEVARVEYDYDGATAVGSDHAYVAASLAIGTDQVHR